jgi:hypothetical protein
MDRSGVFYRCFFCCWELISRRKNIKRKSRRLTVAALTLPNICNFPSHLPHMTPIRTILTQTPRHHTPQLILFHNLVKLPANKLRRIPCPEEAILSIKVVLSAGFLVGKSVFGGELPGTRNVGIGAASAEGVLAGAAAVFGRSAAIAVLRAAA